MAGFRVVGFRAAGFEGGGFRVLVDFEVTLIFGRYMIFQNDPDM